MEISKRELVILGFLVVAAAALYFFLLQPTTTERMRLTWESERLKHESQKIEQILKAIPRGGEGLEEARGRLEEIRARLLPSASVLFTEISRPGKRLGIRFVSFTPKGPDPGQYGEVSANLVIEGTYLDLGRYLEELFGSRYLLSVADIKMSPVNRGDARLRMHLTLKSWIQEESAG